MSSGYPEEAVAIKDGKKVKLAVDAQSGKVSQMSDDDADDYY
jgi:hypothetical protein